MKLLKLWLRVLFWILLAIGQTLMYFYTSAWFLNWPAADNGFLNSHVFFIFKSCYNSNFLNVSNNSLIPNCTHESNRRIIAGFLYQVHGCCPLDFEFAIQCSMKHNITRVNFSLNLLKRSKAANVMQIKYLLVMKAEDHHKCCHWINWINQGNEFINGIRSMQNSYS